MDTSTRLQENISAMVDGELPACEVELTLAALSAPEGRATWHTYQLIGDLLRADSAGSELSPAFAARLARHLADEALPGHPARGVAGDNEEAVAAAP